MTQRNFRIEYSFSAVILPRKCVAFYQKGSRFHRRSPLAFWKKIGRTGPATIVSIRFYRVLSSLFVRNLLKTGKLRAYRMNTCEKYPALASRETQTLTPSPLRLQVCCTKNRKNHQASNTAAEKAEKVWVPHTSVLRGSIHRVFAWPSVAIRKIPTRNSGAWGTQTSKKNPHAQRRRMGHPEP